MSTCSAGTTPPPPGTPASPPGKQDQLLYAHEWSITGAIADTICLELDYVLVGNLPLIRD